LSPSSRLRLRAWAQELHRYRGWVATAAGLGMAGAALGALEPLFYRTLADLLVAVAGRRTPAAAAWPRGAAVLAGLAGLLLAQRLLQTGQTLAVNRVRFDASFDLSQRVLRQLYARPLAFHQQRGAGYVQTRVDRGVAAFGQLVGELLQSLLPHTVNLALLAALLWMLSPRLAVLALAPLPLYLWATLRGAARARRQEARVQEGWSRLYSRVTEVLSAIKTVQAMTAEPHELAHYRRRAAAIFRRLWRQVWLEEGYGHLQNALALAGRMAVAVYGFSLVLSGHLSPGTWIAATSYAALLYQPLAGLAGGSLAAARAAVAADAALDFLADAPVPTAVPTPLPRLRGAIAFEGVGFAYPAAAGAGARSALRDVSFAIAPGETVAVVGPSGGGKTTLTDLLLRFHDPSAGRILLDGRDLRGMPPGALRRQLAVVLQEPLLLQGSIADNVAYGAPAATAAHVRAALRAAHAEEFVARLPQGLATPLGERGARLSGGEKQRLALARALLRDPRILILDEATAHLDAASEAAVHRSLRALAGSRTVIVISHRLDRLPSPDRILVIAEGELLEQGSPAALGARGGYYARLLQPRLEVGGAAV